MWRGRGCPFDDETCRLGNCRICNPRPLPVVTTAERRQRLLAAIADPCFYERDREIFAAALADLPPDAGPEGAMHQPIRDNDPGDEQPEPQRPPVCPAACGGVMLRVVGGGWHCPGCDRDFFAPCSLEQLVKEAGGTLQQTGPETMNDW